MGSRRSKRKQHRRRPGRALAGPPGGITRWFAGLRPRRHPRLALIALAVAAVAVGCGIWHFSSRAGRPGKNIRNVLLISIDTCRADSLGCYGNSPQATPNVDALARDGVLFKSVITPFPMTLPAHCSMLTGTYPETHGVRGNDCRLGDANVTLAKVLRTAGYQTAAFVGGFPLAARFGLNQGFQTYDDQFHKGKDGDEPERKAEEVSRPAMAWLEEHGDQPFFLFLHYYDPHFPYDPPPPFPVHLRRRDRLCRYVDRQGHGQIARPGAVRQHARDRCRGPR